MAGADFSQIPSGQLNKTQAYKKTDHGFMARGFRMSIPMRDDVVIVVGYRIFCKDTIDLYLSKEGGHRMSTKNGWRRF